MENKNNKIKMLPASPCVHITLMSLEKAWIYLSLYFIDTLNVDAR